MSQGKKLRNRFSTIATEYAVRVHAAAEDAELRLSQLEDRDKKRAERKQLVEQETGQKYDALKEE
ncbi:MAG: hypothetical protein KY429_08880 [Actinobacteria bacterium]|nr:hypothetical protein [Actinomycetota bacterium]